jgi:hypothetical protein
MLEQTKWLRLYIFVDDGHLKQGGTTGRPRGHIQPEITCNQAREITCYYLLQAYLFSLLRRIWKYRDSYLVCSFTF